MNRRSFLRGLLALPFVGVAVKRTEQWGWMGAEPSGNFAPSSSGYLGGGTLWRYGSSAGLYDEIGGIDVASIQRSYNYARTAQNPNADANRARFFGA